MAKKKDNTVKEDAMDGMAAQNQASIAAKPTNRTEMMNQAVNLIGVLDDDSLGALMQAMAQIGQEAAAIPDDAAAKNQASIMMKGKVNEDLAAIFGGDETLSEEFKGKIETLFEAALGARMAIEREVIREEEEAKAEEELQVLVEGLKGQINDYISYVAEEWMKENQVAIEKSLKIEMMEEFMTGLRNLFVENWIDIPEDKVDAVEKLAERVQELEAQANQLMEENISLKKSKATSSKEDIVNTLGESMTLAQRERFKVLCEDLDFDEKFENKAKTIMERYFKAPLKPTGLLSEESVIVEDADTKAPKVDPQMAQYLAASRIVAPRK